MKRKSNQGLIQNRGSLAILAAVFVGLVTVVFAQAQLPASDKAINAIYRLRGQPMGTYSEKRTLEAGGNIITTIDADMVFNRMGSKLELKSSSTYVESRDGSLLKVDSLSASSQQPTSTHAKVQGNTLNITTEAGGHTYERSLPVASRLLGPQAARELTTSRLHRVGDTVSYDTFSPELGSIVTMTNKAVAFDDLPAEQQPAGTKIEQTISGMPAPAVLWADSTGWLLRQTTASPLGEIELLRSNAATAHDAPPQDAPLPAETFSRSIVNANIRLPQERLIEKIKLAIIATHPGVVWPDFSASNQTVVEKTADRVILEVRRPMPHGEGVRPVAMTAALRPYLQPNALLQSDDAGVRKIARSVVQNSDGAWDAALALQRWTAENMHFDLGIAVVPASEVAKDRGGTCFGYSVLLASLARSAGIPSRVRIGLVYAGGIWGGHAWVDVLIGQDWIPLDGALYAHGPADAARFSVYTSSLEESTVGSLGGLGQVLGNVDIRILEYTVDGNNTVVEENAKPYSIEGNTYRNPWIGLSVTAPAGFQFTGFDLAWPETTVLAMAGPGGQRIEIHSESASLPVSSGDRDKLLKAEKISGPVHSRRIAGHAAWFAEDKGATGMVFQDKGNIWLVTATGTHATQLLQQISSSIRLEPASRSH